MINSSFLIFHLKNDDVCVGLGAQVIFDNRFGIFVLGILIDEARPGAFVLAESIIGDFPIAPETAVFNHNDHFFTALDPVFKNKKVAVLELELFNQQGNALVVKVRLFFFHAGAEALLDLVIEAGALGLVQVAVFLAKGEQFALHFQVAYGLSFGGKAREGHFRFFACPFDIELDITHFVLVIKQPEREQGSAQHAVVNRLMLFNEL